VSLPYQAALEQIDYFCSTFNEALADKSLASEVRVSLRERRDYWHSIGSRIRRRMAREQGRQRQ
jgi:hypothetical protein